MAITFVDSSTATVITDSTYTLNFPVCLEDDIVLVFTGVGGYENTTMGLGGTGWNILADVYSNGSSDANLGVFWKRMGSTPDTAVTVYSPGGADCGTAIAYVIRGVDTTSAFDASIVTGTGTGVGEPVAPNISPSSIDTFVVTCCSGSHEPGTVVAPVGYTNLEQANVSEVWDNQLAVSSKLLDVSGEEVPGSWSGWNSTTTDAYASATVVLREAVAVPTITIVGTASHAVGAVTQGTLSLPTCLEDDIVVIAVAQGTLAQGDKNIQVLTSGYAQVFDLWADDSYEANLGVFWKRMGSTPDTAVTYASSYANNYGMAAVVTVFRGVDTGTALDVTSTTFSASNTSIPNPSAITPVTEGAVIVICGATSQYYVAVAPTGYGDNPVLKGYGSSPGTLVLMASKHWDGSGEENPGPWTNITNSTGRAALAVTLALRPEVLPVDTPTLAPTSGEYSSTQEIAISCTTPSSTIYYTEDGTTPTIASTEYTGPFTLSTAKTIKAFATATGYYDSSVVTEVYTVSTGFNIRINTDQIFEIYLNTTPIVEAYLGTVKL